MQVQVPQQNLLEDRGYMLGIHIAVDNMGDGNVSIAVPTPTTRPERRRHGMGRVVGDKDVVSTHRHVHGFGVEVDWKKLDGTCLEKDIGYW